MPYPATAPAGNPYGPLVTFETQRAFPPSAVYLGPNDSLLLISRSPHTSTQVHLSYRLLRPDGQILQCDQEFQLQPTAAGFFTTLIPPSEAFILTASITAPTALRGQVYVQLFVAVGNVGPDSTLGALLVQGYCSAHDVLSYPQSRIESSIEGRGWVHDVQVANPAPGAFGSINIPAGVRWILKSLVVTLVATAAVANRTIVLQIITPGGFVNADMVQPLITAAGQTTNYSWAEGTSAVQGAPFSSASLPVNLLLTNPVTISLVVFDFQPTDQLQNISLLVEEFVSN